MLKDYRTALVTGASGGIGEAFARQLAARGMDLVLVARSEGALRALAGELAGAHAIRTHVIVADLAVPGAAQRLYDDVTTPDWQIDLLVNNAGYGKAGTFAGLPFGVQSRMVHLNVNTVVELTHLFLPAMIERRRGGVINLGSTASFQPVPFMAVYGATKAFVLSFSEAIAQEVARHGVHVMALCPGGTATGFQETAGVWEDQRGSMPSAAEVVTAALAAFDSGKRTYVPGFMNKLTAFVAGRLMPRRWVTRAAESWIGARK
ncbi:MAG TPA: SDR family oxidoreductase [Anaerolineae bacterium]|nr:SDR family oxidoreductase [Anaerolineae bacterium]